MLRTGDCCLRCCGRKAKAIVFLVLSFLAHSFQTSLHCIFRNSSHIDTQSFRIVFKVIHINSHIQTTLRLAKVTNSQIHMHLNPGLKPSNLNLNSVSASLPVRFDPFTVILQPNCMTFERNSGVV